jgi:hypothetical protein
VHRGRAATLTAVALLGLGAAAGLVVRGRSPAVSAPRAVDPPARRGIAVVGLRNDSAGGAASWLPTAVAETLSLELGAGDRLRVTPADAAARVGRELGSQPGEVMPAPLLERIRLRLGVDLLVHGRVTLNSPREIVATLEVQDTRDGRVVARASDRASEHELLDLVSRAGASLREQLGVRHSGAGGGGRGLPRDPRAARLYAEGLDRLRVFDARTAIERLELAAAAEPAASAVRSALAGAWAALGFDERALREARAAYELAADLPLVDRLPLEARYRERAGEWTQAAAIHRTLVSRAPDDLELILALAESEIRAGRPEAALAALADARRLPHAAGEPRLDLLESRALGVQGRIPASRERARAAKEKAVQAGARMLVAEALLAGAEGARRQMDLAGAAVACREAGDLFTAGGDRGGAARALAELASVSWYASDFTAARGAAERSLEVARDIGDRGAAARALNVLAGVRADRGELTEARRLYVETHALAIEVSDRDREWVATHNIGLVLWKMGDLPTARRALEESLVLARALPSARREAYSLFSIAHVHLDEGDLTGARTAFGDALALARDHDLGGFAADPMYGLGRVQLEEDDLAAAQRSFAESAATRRRTSNSAFGVLNEIAGARVALEQGRRADAVQAAQAMVQECRRLQSPHQEALALAVLAQAQAPLDPAAARAAEERARSLVQGSEYGALRLTVLARVGSLQAARRDPRAAELLRRTLHEAQKAGLRLQQTECRIGLARLAGDAGELRRLAAEAEAAGLRRLARLARP